MSPCRCGLLCARSPIAQGSRFYVRVERASLPPHAPNMLAARYRQFDGVGTLIPQNPQPCRLLPLDIPFIEPALELFPAQQFHQLGLGLAPVFVGVVAVSVARLVDLVSADSDLFIRECTRWGLL